MKQQILLFLMALLPMVASADDSGNCSGDIDNNVTWTYVESTQTLTISGSGSMGEYGFFPDDTAYFLTHPIGNHHIVVPGRYKSLFEDFRTFIP